MYLAFESSLCIHLVVTDSKDHTWSFDHLMRPLNLIYSYKQYYLWMYACNLSIIPSA
jgi:hypothetical protein